MSKIGFGVVGAGTWGEIHARVYSTSPLSELIAICDLDEDRGKRLANRYGATYYRTCADMVRDPRIDAVGIATPDFAHREPIITCANAGKHILVEKPLATTAEDLDAIVDAVRKNGIRLMVDFHTRWSPPLCAVKDSIDRGEIGALISLYYRLNDTIFVPTEMLSWAEKSSVAWFLGSHAIDTMRWLTGDEVERVYAVSRSRVLASRGIATPDIFQAILEFKNGTIATLENNWILPNSTPKVNDIKINVLGERGMFNLDLTNNQTIERYLETKADHPDILVMYDIHGRPMGFAYESIRHFVECLATGQEFLVTLDDGINTSRTILAILESAAKGEPVTLTSSLE